MCHPNVGTYSIPYMDPMGIDHPKHLSHEKKKPSDFPVYWLVNRDPYYGLL